MRLGGGSLNTLTIQAQLGELANEWKILLRSQLTIYSTSDLADKIHTSGSYPSLLGNNTLIYRTYMQLLTYNSGKAGCYTSLLTVKYGE